VAKTFGVRPSDYLPELNTWEAFCLDEAVAYALAVEENRRWEEVKAGRVTGERDLTGKKPAKPSAKDAPIDVLNHEAFRKK